MIKKVDTKTVKKQTDCQITAGRIGICGGDKRSTEGLVCMHISITNGRKTMVHLHNRILCCHKKEGLLIICSNLDGIGEHYAE